MNEESKEEPSTNARFPKRDSRDCDESIDEVFDAGKPGSVICLISFK